MGRVGGRPPEESCSVVFPPRQGWQKSSQQGTIAIFNYAILSPLPGEETKKVTLSGSRCPVPPNDFRPLSTNPSG
jgi:hypothetical protein